MNESRVKYDFETILDRSGDSSKWAQMREKKPEVPDGIVPLSVADMEFKSPPEVTEGLREYLKDAILGYPCASDRVYQAVLSWVEKHCYWTAEREWLVFTPGVVNGFFQAVRAFTEPGDGVIVMPPVYYPFYSAVTRNDRKLKCCPLKEEKDGWNIDYERLERMAKEDNTRLLILCSPHNPVGRVWTAEELSRLGEICLENQVFVVSDEIHCDLIMPGFSFTSFGSLRKEVKDNAMVCLSPSKTFNLAGLESSCIFIPNAGRRQRFLTELAKTGQMNRLNSIGFQAMELAYTKGEAWLTQLIQTIEENHRFTREYLKNRCPKIRVGELQGTYLEWIDLRAFGWNPQEQERIMLDADLFFDEGSLFGKEGEGFERINLACPRKVLENALERMCAALEKADIDRTERRSFREQ